MTEGDRKGREREALSRPTTTLGERGERGREREGERELRKGERVKGRRKGERVKVKGGRECTPFQKGGVAIGGE